MYGETLGRWRSADLLIGLAFMARREADDRPIGDIAAQGLPFADGLQGQEHIDAQVHYTRGAHCIILVLPRELSHDGNRDIQHIQIYIILL